MSNTDIENETGDEETDVEDEPEEHIDPPTYRNRLGETIETRKIFTNNAEFRKTQ